MNNKAVNFFMEVLRGRKAGIYLSLGRNFGRNQDIKQAKQLFVIEKILGKELTPIENKPNGRWYN